MAPIFLEAPNLWAGGLIIFFVGPLEFTKYNVAWFVFVLSSTTRTTREHAFEILPARRFSGRTKIRFPVQASVQDPWSRTRSRTGSKTRKVMAPIETGESHIHQDHSKLLPAQDGPSKHKSNKHSKNVKFVYFFVFLVPLKCFLF